MTTPPRPDQEINPPAAVVAPGGAAGVFRGRLVIIIGGSATGAAGLFMYNPSLAANDLVESASPIDGVDSKGNIYKAGFTSYGLVSGSTYQATALDEGGLNFWLSTTGETGSYLLTGGVGPGGASGQYFTSSTTFVGQGVPAVVAQDPSNVGSFPIIAETWHKVGTAGQPAFGTGWTNGGGGFANLAFRLTAENEVQIIGAIHHTNTAAQTIFTLPSGYIPASSQQVTCLDANAPSGMEVSSGGAVEMLAAPSAAANTEISCRISLDL